MQTSLVSLTEKLSNYLLPEQVLAVHRAYYYAEQAHDGQLRRSGQPYVTHPLAVANILADMHMDSPSLIAAMLHDVIEDTGVKKEALATQFGLDVADIVDGVSKLTQFECESKAQAQAQNFQKMALAMARDIRVILVKLADRLHNMRTLEVLKPEQRRRIAHETLEIYAPIAQRLGMHAMRVEFEDLSFVALHPMRARRIQAAVRKAAGNRRELVSKVKKKIQACLNEEGIPAQVFGREKHLYGIYRKMREQRKAFSEIMDVFAFRIVVDSVDTCYRVLGAIHNLYKPVPDQFTDYIAMPKANGYQSLHTVLFGMHGVPIEVQIRTREMEEMANHGIAAHWLYKSGKDALPKDGHARTRQWMQGLLEMQEKAGNPLEFIESVKVDLFPGEVFVFTPRGDILELPVGATPVDFAYTVHTDVGNACVACRIDRRLAPLSSVLTSGQTVEIVTSSGGLPNPGWLNFVVTAKARSNIRHFLKHQHDADAKELGKRLLERSLATLGTSMVEITQDAIGKLLEETGKSSFEQVLKEIGAGDRVAILTANRLVGHKAGTGIASSGATALPLAIRDTEGLMLSYARCCFPIPGDHIAGHISAGRGIVVHRENCRNVAEFLDDPERSCMLRWADDVQGEFHVEIVIELQSRRGIVATLANKVSSLDVNIERISIDEKDAELSRVHLQLAVKNRVHLARVIRRIRTLKAVIKVYRDRH